MTKSEFDEVVATTKLSAASREAARLVFVEGKRPVEVGQEMGLSKVRMSQISKIVREAQEGLEAEKRGDAHARVPGFKQVAAAIDASYALAVKEARDALGDDVALKSPGASSRNTGPVVARTEFHLVQSVGKDLAIVHDLAKLERAPAVGRNVAIQYEGGRGSVEDRSQERTRGGRSL